ncbi:MAG TPA: methylenetetrahydrofolate reductase C-terminal domain-containing protein [Streptosporangiaceae bacterium]|nr:methylenetetrahydrofolate reductase C-terminal domain-containing protein [Streptosporangiaceae bacterium]
MTQAIQTRESGRDEAAPPREQPRPHHPRPSARSMYRMQRLLRPNAFYRVLAAGLESFPRLRALFTRAEERVKTDLFGCSMCGQCALPVTGYTCPMSCPKQMRNGPCGGVGADGACEVYPELRCVWLEAYERADSQRRAADLNRLQRPIDQRVWGQSSWINYWQGRDEDLWTAPEAVAVRPGLHPVSGEGRGDEQGHDEGHDDGAGDGAGDGDGDGDGQVRR